MPRMTVFSIAWYDNMSFFYFAIEIMMNGDIAYCVQVPCNMCSSNQREQESLLMPESITDIYPSRICDHGLVIRD